MKIIIAAIVAALALLTGPASAQTPFTYQYQTPGGIVHILAGQVGGNVLPYSEMVDASGSPFGVAANPMAIGFGTGVTLPSFATTQHFICDSGCSSVSTPFGQPIGANGSAIGFKDGFGNLQPVLGDSTNGLWVSIKGAISLPVTGTFWQATQPVSAASLPLPTGAATQTTLAAIQTALGSPLQAGGQVTNAGTFAVQLSGATNNINNIAGTVSLPTGASTSANQTTANTSLSTISTNTGTTNTNLGAPGAVACATDTASCSLNQLAQRQAQRLTSVVTALGTPFQAGGSIANTAFGISGTLPAFAATPTVNIGTAPTIAVTGTFFQATQPVSIAATVGVNQTQMNGVAVLAGNGVSGTGSQRVNIASDNTPFSVNAVESGTWNITNISGTVSLPTGAATAANQTTANTSLASIDTKTPALGQALAAGSTPVVLPAAQAQPYQYQTGGAMQPGLSVTTSTALTPPGGSLYARICVRGANINYTDDGSTTPTATVGTQLLQNACTWEAGATLLANFRAIQSGGVATLDISYFK